MCHDTIKATPTHIPIVVHYVRALVKHNLRGSLGEKPIAASWEGDDSAHALAGGVEGELLENGLPRILRANNFIVNTKLD